MDLRLLLRQIAVKHGTEDGASHGQHILGGREGGRRQMRQNTCRQNHTVVAKFDKRAQVVLFSSCRHNFSNPTDRQREREVRIPW